MKRLARLLPLIAVLGLCGVSARPGDAGMAGVGGVRTRTADGIAVHTIEVDPRDPHVRVTVATAAGFPRGDEDFGSLLARYRPIVAVDGAYFSKETLAPIGDVVIDGQVRYQGMMGTALALTRDGEAVIRRVVPDHATDWTGYDVVLACGPALVLNGRIDVDPVGERFHDPHVMGATRRMGIAVLNGGHLLFVTTQSAVTFARWAAVMQSLGARDALNLDAGASLALAYRGRVIEQPGRRLTNLIVVVPRVWQAHQAISPRWSAFRASRGH
jgi:exopolysaccharide biosynthesis protein